MVKIESSYTYYLQYKEISRDRLRLLINSSLEARNKISNLLPLIRTGYPELKSTTLELNNNIYDLNELFNKLRNNIQNDANWISGTICKYCGSKVFANEHSCPQCGAPL